MCVRTAPRIIGVVVDCRRQHYLYLAKFCEQYVMHLASTVNFSQLRDVGSKEELVGIGFFTTISTRFAGFQMLDYRLLNAGLIIVITAMMYGSNLPFLATLKVRG